VLAAEGFGVVQVGVVFVEGQLHRFLDGDKVLERIFLGVGRCALRDIDARSYGHLPIAAILKTGIG
jgi:hypothetical protein